MEILTTLKHEAREVGLVTLYFMLCFGFILTLKKLLLATYNIEFYAFSSAMVGALIVGKVVVVLDKTRAGTRLDRNHSLGAAALYKTMIYSLCTALVLVAEKMFHAYRESGTLSEALMVVWMHQDPHIILAKILCIGLAFMGYHLYAGVDRRLGEGRLRNMVFKRP
ncbi:MAG TPA: hypothetical protein PKK23_08485 [Nitrospirales bacterium]|nr:hypothetical protein [Nitrospirales bacterium]